MRWSIYTLLILGILVTAPKGTDVGKLQPIEVVLVSKRDDMVMIETDTGDKGIGQSINEAVSDLKQRSPGAVILKTAEYLLVEKGTETFLRDMKGVVKGNIRVCRVQGSADLRLVAGYLNIHRPQMCLRDLKTDEIEEILIIEKSAKENKEKMKIVLDK